MTAQARAVVVDKDLPTLLEGLVPFRTEAKTGRHGKVFEDGMFAGYREPRKVFAAQVGASALETGMLIDEWYHMFVHDYTSGTVDYVIYSYDTIIAWHTASLTRAPYWTVTDTVITATTSKHQIRVLLALREKS